LSAAWRCAPRIKKETAFAEKGWVAGGALLISHTLIYFLSLDEHKGGGDKMDEKMRRTKK
jgi:hypothetical protein